MALSRLERGQKLVLAAMAVALISVLVLLSALIRDDATSRLSPVVPSSQDETSANIVTPKVETVARTPASATSMPESSEQISSTLAHSGAAEILAARRIIEFTAGVGEVRELPKRQEVPLNFLGDQETTAYLRRLRADSQRREFIQRQQALLSALDLIPAPDEGFPPTVRTRASHLIAFYDPDQSQIFVTAAGRDSDPPDVTLVQQYAHALIDQHFEYASLTNAALNADTLRARDALIEGDATAVVLMHSLGGIEQAADSQRLAELSEHLAEAEITDYEGYLTSWAMQEVVAFPYWAGARFVAALLQEGWWPAVNAAYRDPPISTEQILHPAKYIETPRDEPRVVQLPSLASELGEGWRLITQDVLGELILRAHLDKYLPETSEARAAAAGWGGDLAAVWQHSDGRVVLVVRILWDSADEADEFVRSYVTVIDRRLRGASRIVRSILPPDGRWWRGETGNAYLEQQGQSAIVIWTPDTETMERVLAAFVFEEE